MRSLVPEGSRMVKKREGKIRKQHELLSTMQDISLGQELALKSHQTCQLKCLRIASWGENGGNVYQQ